MNTAFLGATLVAFAALSTAASATTVTFNGQSNTSYEFTSLTHDGLTFSNVAGDEEHFHELNGADIGWVSNGTSTLSEDRDTRIQMVAANASIFTLGAFDIAEAIPNSTTGYSVTGYLNGSLVGTLTGDFSRSFLTLSGLSFGSVDRVVFDGIGGNGFFQLDNINVDIAYPEPDPDPAPAAVPEPASWALMLGGFGLVGGAMRARRKSEVSSG